MTVEHTPDSDAALAQAPKKTRRTTTKTATRTKKTPATASHPSSDEAQVAPTAEKKKTPTRRPRKKNPPPSSQNPSPDDTREVFVAVEPLAESASVSSTEQAKNNEEKPAKLRSTRGKKNVTKTATSKKSATESVTQAVSEEKQEEKPLEEKKQPSAAKRGRGRVKKAVAESVEKPESGKVEAVASVARVQASMPLELSLPTPILPDPIQPVSGTKELVAEPQSAGIERAVSEVPDVREERKARRPRRVTRAKNLENAKIEAESLTELESEDLAYDADANMAVAEDTEQSGDDVGSKSRRGRRGGRGKRGKKRNLVAAAAEAAAYDDMDDEDESFLHDKKSAALAKGGTSLGEGKPGRARTTAPKKAVEVAQRKMFISMVQGEQVEVALVENGIIHEYYLEMLHQVKTKGNIYKGVVNNIDANLQAAFVNYGANKNGFLQIDEIHPEYYQAHHEVAKGKKFPPIQKIIKPGQEILVQVVKEPTGNKGAFLTTWLSLPGRFLVLTPGQEQIGVSRKVESDEERVRLREMMTGIEPGAGLGVIVRTVSAGTSKTTLKSDLQYLKRVWREIRKRGVSDTAPMLLYRESGLAERAIRDYLTDDVTEVWVDNLEVADRLRETVSLLFPRKKELIRMHADVRQTLWERFNMQRQLEQIYAREVVLPSGGRLVFDQTEALMAIDINSGKISGKGNFESMALKTNLEAAEAIARHLKLRDIGGQVVVDFIEMRDKSHVREVEKTLRNAMKNDRARHDVARISSFGLLEIVRQRTGSSALAISMEPCPHCRGTGVRRNLEWQALQALCEIERKGRSAQHGKHVFETSSSELALYLLNHKRQRISELEEQLRVSIEVRIS